MKIFLFFLLALNCFGSSFLEITSTLQEKPLNWQRLYLSAKLKKVEQEYISWLNSCSESEFTNHLKFSHFGDQLYGRLKTQESHESEFRFSAIRRKYIELLIPEFETMRNHLRTFYRTENFIKEVYEVSAWFAGAYKNLFSNPQSEDNFHTGEKYLINQMHNLPKDLQETVKILLFLEFQLLKNEPKF
jgi:hypothetical protein